MYKCKNNNLCCFSCDKFMECLNKKLKCENARECGNPEDCPYIDYAKEGECMNQLSLLISKKEGQRYVLMIIK